MMPYRKLPAARMSPTPRYDFGCSVTLFQAPQQLKVTSLQTSIPTWSLFTCRLFQEYQFSQHSAKYKDTNTNLNT